MQPGNRGGFGAYRRDYRAAHFGYGIYKIQRTSAAGSQRGDGDTAGEKSEDVDIEKGPNIQPLPAFDPLSENLEGPVLSIVRSMTSKAMRSGNCTRKLLD